MAADLVLYGLSFLFTELINDFRTSRPSTVSTLFSRLINFAEIPLERGVIKEEVT